MTYVYEMQQIQRINKVYDLCLTEAKYYRTKFIQAGEPRKVYDTRNQQGL